MKIRFAFDAANCFRRGNDVRSNVVILDIEPSILLREERDLIAGCMDDAPDRDGVFSVLRISKTRSTRPELVTAKLPTLPSLLEAIREMNGEES